MAVPTGVGTAASRAAVNENRRVSMKTSSGIAGRPSLGSGVAAWPFAAKAQPTSSKPLIGFLGPGSKTTSGRFYDGFFQGMQELGYQLGRDYRFEDRYADGNPGRLPSLAQELVVLKPDVIVTGTSMGALAVKQLTAGIPIVAITLTDPIGMGLVASEAHPNTDVTGTLIRLSGMTGKQLEIGFDLMPGARKVGLLINPKNSLNGLVDSRIARRVTFVYQTRPLTVYNRDFAQ